MHGRLVDAADYTETGVITQMATFKYNTVRKFGCGQLYFGNPTVLHSLFLVLEFTWYVVVYGPNTIGIQSSVYCRVSYSIPLTKPNQRTDCRDKNWAFWPLTDCPVDIFISFRPLSFDFRSWTFHYQSKLRLHCVCAIAGVFLALLRCHTICCEPLRPARNGNYVVYLTPVGLTFDFRRWTFVWRRLTCLVARRCFRNEYTNSLWFSSIDGSVQKTSIYDYGFVLFDFQLSNISLLF